MTKLALLLEADRARYNLPEEVEYESGLYGRKSVAELKAQTGYTLDRISAGLQGIVKIQADGSEVIERDGVAAVALAWLILWDNGHKIPWPAFDVRGTIDFAQGETDETEDGEEGKAQDPDTSSTTTTEEPV